MSHHFPTARTNLQVYTTEQLKPFRNRCKIFAASREPRTRLKEHQQGIHTSWKSHRSLDTRAWLTVWRALPLYVPLRKLVASTDLTRLTQAIVLEEENTDTHKHGTCSGLKLSIVGFGKQQFG